MGYSRRWSGVAVLFVWALVVASDCGDDGPSGMDGGTIVVRNVTTGTDPDPDGYTVTVDNGMSRSLAVNGSTSYNGIAAGSHDVALSGAAGNCAVAGANPRTVQVTVGGSVEVVFDIACGTAAGGRVVFWALASDGAGGFQTDIFAIDVGGTNLVNLTDNPADDRDPAVSPDGTKIAFQTDRDGNAEIYVMDMDGGNPVNVTNEPADDREPAWSRDGTRIAFDSFRDGNSIWVMNADGTNPMKVVQGPGNNRSATWSQDDSQIAFTANAQSANGDIYVVNVDGTGLTQIINDPANDQDPAWSPDGTRIAFVSQRDGNSEIYVMNPDGTAPVRLTNDPETDTGPAWSSDGARIAFMSRRVAGADQVHVMNADGSNVFAVTTNGGTGPSWVPEP